MEKKQKEQKAVKLIPDLSSWFNRVRMLLSLQWEAFCVSELHTTDSKWSDYKNPYKIILQTERDHWWEAHKALPSQTAQFHLCLPRKSNSPVNYCELLQCWVRSVLMAADELRTRGQDPPAPRGQRASPSALPLRLVCEAPVSPINANLVH